MQRDGIEWQSVARQQHSIEIRREGTEKQPILFKKETTFFCCKDKILRVQCGCFYGDLAQFREIVKKTHGVSKYAKEYLAIADLMELHFSDEEEKQEADE